MNDLLLRALRGETTERSPIWIMRQAGRYLPEYRAVREKVGFLGLCKTPELAAQVTIQPIDRLDVDAAILFSDIMIPAEPMGLQVEFKPGPVVDRPVRSSADVDRLAAHDPEETLPFVYESIRIIAAELRDRVPLIGFGAAPFTLATYLVEGGASKHHAHIKGMLYSDPAALHGLLEKIADTTVRYLAAQARSGANALQLFDSWAGLLSPAEFREFGMRHTRVVIERLRAMTDVPLIYFALNGAHLLEEIRDCGADAVGVDWRMPLDVASAGLGDRFVLQGNLDPRVLLADAEVIRGAAQDVLRRGRELPGHVFNLGHGILPMTPVEHAQELVRTVKTWRPG